MHSTEFNGVLANEKEKLYDLVKEEDYKESILCNDSNRNSYFVKYENSRHLHSELEEYNSLEIVSLLNELRQMWNANDVDARIVSIVMAGYIKSRNEKGNYLKKVDLYNYVM